MPDPASMDGFLGVKFASLVAGLAGSIVSLSYLRELTKFQMVLAVMAGTLTASYLTPVAVWYFDMSPALSNGTAFLLGLTSMNIVPGLIRVSEAFKRNPSQFLGKGKK